MSPADDAHAIVDFVLHLLPKVCVMKEIHQRLVRLCVNYMGNTIVSKEVKLQQYQKDLAELSVKLI